MASVALRPSKEENQNKLPNGNSVSPRVFSRTCKLQQFVKHPLPPVHAEKRTPVQVFQQGCLEELRRPVHARDGGRPFHLSYTRCEGGPPHYRDTAVCLKGRTLLAQGVRVNKKNRQKR